LTRAQRPPGFNQLQDIVREAINGESNDRDKDQVRIAYVNVARGLSCPAAAIIPRLSPCVEAAVQFMVEQGELLPAWRKKQFETLREIAEDLRPLSDEIRHNDLSGLIGYQAKMPLSSQPRSTRSGYQTKTLSRKCTLVGSRPQEWPHHATYGVLRPTKRSNNRGQLSGSCSMEAWSSQPT
jgi:hypothetical protein